MQNFGDYLSEYLVDRLFLRTARHSSHVRVIGSALDDYFIPDPAVIKQENDGRADLQDTGERVSTLVAWGLGVREPGGLSREKRAQVDILAVRGPVSASELRLGADVAMGDPGLLLPAIYSASKRPKFSGKALCIPHFHDQRTDVEILKSSGCDLVLRPAIVAEFAAVEQFIDAIVSARFVLCASLHAAIVALAYRVPFAFWQTDTIDLPTKWRDFAEAVGLTAEFARDFEGGERLYKECIEGRIKLPSLWELLATAPYPLRPDAILKVLQFELNDALDCTLKDEIASRIQLLDSRAYHFAAIAEESRRIVALLNERIGGLEQQAGDDQRSLGDLRNAVEELRRIVDVRDGEILGLNADIHVRDEELKRRDADLKDREVELARRDAMLKDLTALRVKDGDKLAKVVDQHKRDRENMENVIAQSQRENDELSGQLSATRSELAIIKASTTWRAMGVARRVGSHMPSWARTQLRRSAKALWWTLTPHRTAERVRFLRARAAAAAAGHALPHLTTALMANAERVPENPKRLLVADYRIPMAEVSAGERATVGILRDLAEMGYEVVFLPNGMEASRKHERELKAYGVEVVTRESGYDSSVAFLRARGHEFGAFYLIRVDVAETMLGVIREVAPYARVIFHAPDLHFLREMRQAEIDKTIESRAKAEDTRRREFAIMRRVDHVVVVSPAEVPYLKAELPELPVSVFPALYVPVEAAPAPFATRKHLFFLGGFAHTPNVNAVEWFSKEVWPLIRDRLPGVEFHIVGAEAPPAVTELANIPGIKVVGFVPDLTPILTTMRVGVAPLLYGAGIKGKVGMTMGAGIPCVCTDIAAEGMHVQDGVHALIADDPRHFADAVVKLYGDEVLWNRLSRNGRVLIAQSFGDAANRASLMRVLDAAHALPLDLVTDYCRSLAPRAVPVPDDEANVDVSIIVPVYNQWRMTYACLNSILETTLGNGVCYELILADDGSTDETVNAEMLYPGLKVVKTERNVGFLRNCNNATRHARGRHILLLNNDTIVLPGWLENLYRTLEDDPGIAIAGSKMLYPDGLIQEAGAVLFSDGTANNTGRGCARHTPVFNIEREVDYISGCSILVRKSFWDAVGGFDERYKNAYCEDSDLAMSARSSGMRVVYQPASEVIHFEHASYADQAPSHNTALQDHNIRLLREKWKDVFARDHYPPVPWQLAASRAERTIPPRAMKRRKSGKLNVLYFSPFPSHPANHGNRATINQFASWIRNAGHKVHFALLQSHEYEQSDLDDMRAAWDSLDVLPFSNPMMANGHDIPFDGWYEEGLGERIRCLCDRYEIDIVFCSYIFQSKLLEFVPSHMLKVIDTHDKMGNRYDMLRKNGQPLEFFSCTPAEEGRYLQRADIVIGRREEEARYFDEVAGRAISVVIPHIEAPRFLDKRFNRMEKVGVVASANRINLALVREYLETIDRQLRGRPCPFVVEVAGQVAEMVRGLSPGEAAVFRRPWVSMRGFVEDIGEFYSELDLVVSPVTMGTGINVKTVQAMAFGMPLLTTECGSKGIETGDPMHIHADLKSLVQDLFALHRNPDALQRLAELSRKRYLQFYSEGLKGFDRIFEYPGLIQATPFSLAQ